MLPKPPSSGGLREADKGFHSGEGHSLMSLQAQLNGYRLVTAEILYHMPDHPGLLQTFVWQEMDIAPRFPVLNKFLEFWHKSLDGKLHSVRVAGAKLIGPSEWRHTEHLRYLN
jgi:uncharacterized protein Usg